MSCSILGPQADEKANYEYAALKASNEVMGLSGREKFFALYNRGTNLVELQDYGGAALIYDEAFLYYERIFLKPTALTGRYGIKLDLIKLIITPAATGT